MSTDRDVTRIVRSWLHEDGYEDADRILNLVLDEIDTTPQRSATWLARRFPTLSTYARYGLVAAALVLAAVIGIGIYANSVGGPGPTPTPSPPITQSPSLAASPSATPVPDPLAGTSWMAPETTCAQQIDAIEAAGFTADQITQSGLDPTCASGITNQYSLAFFADGRLIVQVKGAVTHPATYRMAGAQTFESTENGTPVCLTYQFAIDGDLLTIEISDYRCGATSVAPLSDQVNLTAIFETSSFNRQP